MMNPVLKFFLLFMISFESFAIYQMPSGYAKLIGALYSPNDEVGDVVAFTQAVIDKSLSLDKGALMLNTKVLDHYNITLRTVIAAQL